MPHPGASHFNDYLFGCWADDIPNASRHKTKKLQPKPILPLTTAAEERRLQK
jgi:hypothetical protein